MSQAPVADMTAEGYQSPQVIQFNVYLDNRVGRLLDLVRTLEEQALRIVGLSVVNSSDFAVVRLITSKAGLARRLLERHELAFSENQVIVVELSQRQSLGSLCKALLAAEVNIHYAYGLLMCVHGYPTVALATDDPVMAAQVMSRKMFVMLGESDFRNLGPADEDEGPRLV